MVKGEFPSSFRFGVGKNGEMRSGGFHQNFRLGVDSNVLVEVVGYGARHCALEVQRLVGSPVG